MFKSLWLFLGTLTLLASLGLALGLIERPPHPKPDAHKVGLAVGRTTGKFVRGFVKGVVRSN